MSAIKEAYSETIYYNDRFETFKDLMFDPETSDAVTLDYAYNLLKDLMDAIHSLENTIAHNKVEPDYEVTESRKYSIDGEYPVCPKCGSSMEREYQNYCDRCGAKLNWRKYGRKS